MRNVIMVSVLLFIAMISGAFCIAWYGQAYALRKSVEQSIATINEKQKFITYDTITTSGFPSNLYLTITKPHFHGRMDTFLQSMQPIVAPLPGTAIAPTTMPVWDEDDQLDGRIVFGINALSNMLTFSMQGNWQQISKIGDKTFSSSHVQTGNSTCLVQMQGTSGMISNLWNFQSLKRDAKDILQDIRMLDCGQAGSSLTDATTKAPLATGGASRFYVTNTTISKAHQLRVYLKASDIEITPQGDAMIASYIQSLYPQYPYPINFAVYGKQNMEVDFNLDGPLEAEKDGNPAIHLSLNKFDITNAVYEHHMSLQIDNHTIENTRTAKVVLNSESSFTEQYDTMVAGNLRGIIMQAYTSTDPRIVPLQAQMQKYTPDQLYAIFYPALFNFHALGKVTENIDATYQGTPDLASGKVTLANVELSSAIYGLKINGAGTMAQRMPQEGNITISCANCLKMIDDIVGYSQRIQKVFSYLSPERTDIGIDATQADAFKRFLSVIAPAGKTSADNTLTYAITVDAAGNTNINGKSWHEIMSIYNEYVKPALKQAAIARQQHG